MFSPGRLFRNPAFPAEYRPNFTHLLLDMAWFGVLSGSSLNFLSIYAARLGASVLQLGLLTGVGAAVTLALAIPAGRWIERRPIGKAMFWTAVVYRLGFLLFIPLPLLLGGQGQIRTLILLTALMAIPLTALGVGFNVLLASAVPQQWRAHLVGGRNVAFSLTFMTASLACGYLLDRLPFPSGYQVVFAIGFLGAALSTLHIYYVRPHAQPEGIAVNGAAEAGKAGEAAPSAPLLRPGSALRLDIWRSPFRRVLLAMLGFHLAQYLAIPIFPIFMVDVLQLNDQQIGVGTALFYLAVLLGSMQLHRAAHRLGNKSVTALGVIGMGAYPFLLSFSSQVWQYYAISFIGGLGWSFAGGASTNYMLENIPPGDRPAHFAWYTVVLNACVLVGSLLGPTIARDTALPTALLVFGILRALAGLALWRFG